jgi:tRNA U38,U39,U40 pseudouridine synthase TruA
VKDDFHARFDATYRTYEYYISLEKIRSHRICMAALEKTWILIK